VLLCGIAVLAVLGARVLRPQGIRLQDGTYLRVLATTTGPQHHFATGRRYERAPYRWLPSMLRDRLGWRASASAVQVTDADSLMVWFAIHVPGTTNPPPRLFRSVDLIGPSGNLMSIGAQSPVTLADGTRAGLVLFPGLHAAPEGARLRFRHGTGTGLVMETAMPNPSRGTR